MPTIRDVVRALATRDGVDAVIVLGRDGLIIDASARDGMDTDGLAALVPSVVAACGRLGNASSRGDFTFGAMEYGSGTALVASLNADTLLAIFVRANVSVGTLLYELHRHRAAIAGLL